MQPKVEHFVWKFIYVHFVWKSIYERFLWKSLYDRSVTEGRFPVGGCGDLLRSWGFRKSTQRAEKR